MKVDSMGKIKTIVIVILAIICLILTKCSSDRQSEIDAKQDYIEYLESNNKSLNIEIDSLTGSYLSREKALTTELDGLLVVNKKLHDEIVQLKKLTGHDVVAGADIVIKDDKAVADTIWMAAIDTTDISIGDEYFGRPDSIYKCPYTVKYRIYYNKEKEGIIIDTIKSEHELSVFLDDDANINVITENGAQVVDLDSYVDPKQLKKLGKKYNKNNFNLSVGFGGSAIATKDGIKFGPGINISVGKTLFSW